MLDTLSDPGAHDAPALREVVRTVRRRWRLRRLLTALAQSVAAALLLLVVTVWLLDRYRYSPDALALLPLFYVGLALLAAWALRPLWRSPSDRQIALYLEEHEPSLRAAVLSAVVPDGAARSRALAARQAELAAAACRAVDGGRRVERRRLRDAAALTAAALAAVALLALWQPQLLRNAAGYLWPDWLSAAPPPAAYGPYQLSVTPGDAQLARGSDQLIGVRLDGFGDDAVAVDLLSRPAGGSGDWRRQRMGAAAEPGLYELFLFDLEAAVDYAVDADGVRSPTYRIDVIEFPTVTAIELNYRYPDYSGLPPRRVDDGGDIVALTGTEVTLLITPSRATPAGDLVLDGERRVALRAEPDGRLRGELRVTGDGVYRIDLQAVGIADGPLAAASGDYTISALSDRAPTVTLLKPGRDEKLTAIDEPFFEIEADDDLRVARVELMLTVNGEPRAPLLLHQGNATAAPVGAVGAGADRVRAAHTLYLEDLDLAPGDVISYYARAVDNAAGGADGGPQQTATDMYFLEIRPFERVFRAADQQGGGGGGGQQGQNEGELAAQQRELVVATYKAVRDRATTAETVFVDTMKLLSSAQARIRDRVEAIVRRIGSRDILQLDEGYQVMAEALPKAVAAMRAAETEFDARRPEQALKPVQQALRELQRAEAAFREAQVTQNAQGGGGGTANAADLEELFKLELDKLRNQYETVQRAQQGGAPSLDVDAVLQRLKELAQRQQRENERARRRLQSSGGGGGGNNQRALAEQVEELVRQLEKLSRERPTPEQQRLRRQLAEAAQAMRDAADAQNGAAAGENALERLRDARDALDRDRDSTLRQALDGARDRSQQLLDRQRRIAAEVDRLSGSEPSADSGQNRGPSGQQSGGQQGGGQQGGGQQSGGQQGGGQQGGGQQGGGQQGGGQQGGGGQAGGSQQSGTDRSADARGGASQRGNGGDDNAAADAVAAGSDARAGDAEFSERLRALLQQKEALRDDVRALEQRLRELAGDSRVQQPDTARRLQLSANALRDARIDAKIRQAQAALQNRAFDYADALEQQIDDGLDQLVRELDQTADMLQPSREQRLARALERLDDLGRGLGALRERIAERSDARRGDAQRGDAQRGDAQRGDAQNGDAQNGDGGGQGGSAGATAATGAASGRAGADGSGVYDGDGRFGGTRAQWQREYAVRRGEMRALAQTLRDEALDTDLNNVLQRLAALEAAVLAGDGDALDALQSDVVQQLRELEFRLRRELTADRLEPLVRADSSTPPAYRDVIEAYFRELSQERR